MDETLCCEFFVFLWLSNKDSNHHLEHKRPVVHILLCRAETVVSEPEDVEKEVKDVKKVLTVNGYKKWSFQIPNKKVREDDNKREGPTANKHPVCITYISGLSEQLQRVCKFYGIPSYHKPFNTLRSLLVNPKDKAKKEKRCRVVYKVTCSACDEEYIGETARMLGTSFREHTFSWKTPQLCHRRTHLFRRSSLHTG